MGLDPKRNKDMRALMGVLSSLTHSARTPPARANQNLRAAKGPERSGGTQPSNLVFSVGSGRRSACTMGK